MCLRGFTRTPAPGVGPHVCGCSRKFGKERPGLKKTKRAFLSSLQNTCTCLAIALAPADTKVTTSSPHTLATMSPLSAWLQRHQRISWLTTATMAWAQCRSQPQVCGALKTIGVADIQRSQAHKAVSFFGKLTSCFQVLVLVDEH